MTWDNLTDFTARITEARTTSVNSIPNSINVRMFCTDKLIPQIGRSYKFADWQGDSMKGSRKISRSEKETERIG